ncbi:MAG: hypothetical protein ACLFRF_04135 [Desulfobacterales bacterium]
MDKKIDLIINAIGDAHRENISGDSRHYVEVDIGRTAEKMGLAELVEKYRGSFAIVPLKQPVPGMKVRIDGRTFVNYKQYESGVAVPDYVARDGELPYQAYTPNHSMILNS